MQRLLAGRRYLLAFPAGLTALLVLFHSAPVRHLQQQLPPLPSPPEGYNYLQSLSTPDGRFFRTVFSDDGELEGMNPNIIPHPTKEGVFYLVALRVISSHWFSELTCEASFTRRGDQLQCHGPVMMAPIAVTKSAKCEGDIGFFTMNVGPHDARVFYGPEHPYMMWGSNSQYNCFGLWVQDFRLLVDWPFPPGAGDPLRFPLDLPRPAPVGRIEKNWFMFWNDKREVYLHYDVHPQRAFAKLSQDGSVGPDLAPAVRERDSACLAAYMPQMGDPGMESIHQATNALEVILCKRDDSACLADDNGASKTFIMHIFQHKTFYEYHSLYEPYVMLFSNKAPFALHAISAKPFWIAGRQHHGALKGHASEMFYVTSVNWKGVDNKYTGYLDDVLLLGFGFEDKAGGGLDVTAESLLGDLSYCAG